MAFQLMNGKQKPIANGVIRVLQKVQNIVERVIGNKYQNVLTLKMCMGF